MENILEKLLNAVIQHTSGFKNNMQDIQVWPEYLHVYTQYMHIHTKFVLITYVIQHMIYVVHHVLRISLCTVLQYTTMSWDIPLCLLLARDIRCLCPSRAKAVQTALSWHVHVHSFLANFSFTTFILQWIQYIVGYTRIVHDVQVCEQFCAMYGK